MYRSLLLPLLLGLGCSPAVAELKGKNSSESGLDLGDDGDGSSTGDDGGDDGDDGGDGDDGAGDGDDGAGDGDDGGDEGGDGGDGDEGGDPSPWEGSWSGEMTITLTYPDWGDWSTSCEAEIEVEVDEEGNYEGEAGCDAPASWSSIQVDAVLSGRLGDGGEAGGTADCEFESREIGSSEHAFEVEGEADDDTIELGFEEEIEQGGEGYTFPVIVEGSFELERD